MWRPMTEEEIKEYNRITKNARQITIFDDKKKVIYEQSKYFQGSLTDKELISLLNVSRSAYYHIKKELKGELKH